MRSWAYPFARVSNVEPPPQYARLRETEPVAKVRLPGGTEAYLVTRYDDVQQVLSDSRFHTDFDRSPAARTMAVRFDTFLNNDPEAHQRMRRLLTREFTARRAEEMAPALTAIAGELFDAMAAAGPPADLRACFAVPFPVLVVCELLGVPVEDRERFRHWASLVVYMAGHDVPDLAAAGEELVAYLTKLVGLRRGEPGDDLLSVLVRAQDQGTELSTEDIVAIGMVLVYASQQASVNQILVSAVALLRHGDQFAALSADESLVDKAVEELLRYVGPADTGLVRVTAEDVDIGGVRVARDETVIIALPSANRDCRRFDRADELDVLREPGAHLAFGWGGHFCLGAALARVELRIALGGLAARFRGLRLAVDPEELYWRPGMLVSGFEEVPVHW